MLNLRSVRFTATIGLIATTLFVSTSSLAQAPAPQLTSVVPSSGLEGATLTVVLNGSGFSQSSTLGLSGTGINIQSIRLLSPSAIELVLTAKAGTYLITISNGSSRSNSVTLTILPAGTPPAPPAPPAPPPTPPSTPDGSGTTAGSDLEVTSLGIGSGVSDPYQVWLSDGYAYIADYTGSVVTKVSLADKTVTTLAGKMNEFGSADGIGTRARFGQPAGVWADANNVYVTDAYFDTVRRISLATGEVTTLAGSAGLASGSSDGIGAFARFQSPHGIWGDGTNLYVCDTLNFTLRKIAMSTGKVTTLAGAAGMQGTEDGIGSSARFYAPLDVWGNGTYLYIADGSAIRQVNIDTGEVLTIAGNPAIDGYVDGSGADARFSFVTGIWGDDANHLFVADSGNNVIRRISLDTGLVTTVAGTDAQLDNPTDIAGLGNTYYIPDRAHSDVKVAVAPTPPPSSSTGTGPGTPPPDSGGSTPTSPGSGVTLPPPVTQLTFQLQNFGGMSQVTSGESATVQVGYARFFPEAGSIMPVGMGIFGYRRDGVLISEASVPVSNLIFKGRFPAQIYGAVNTGLAVANPNTAAPALLSFYLTDAQGVKVYSGTTQVPPAGLVVAFLNQSPFAPPSELGIDLTKVRTFTFTSSLPIGITAIRGLTNERSDFLMTTLPVIDLSSPTDSSPVVFAHFAEGGGWKTEVTLVNPVDSALYGVAEFFSGNSRQAVPYMIGSRSALTIPMAGTGSEIRSGWIQVTPWEGMASPSGLLVFSYTANGVTVTEAGLPALSQQNASRIFVEASGDFNQSKPGSIQSGIALSNSSNSDISVSLDLYALDGTSMGLMSSVTVPARGQVARFLDQLPGFGQLPRPFQGFLRISGPRFGVIGLRSRYNERGDFLISTTSPASEAANPSTESLFPFFVDGGGYTTQFVLFNGRPGPASTGTLLFLNSEGKPLPLRLR